MPVAECIKNRGEYYNSHYLETNFEKDVQELVREWTDARSPAERLAGRGELYFRAKQDAAEALQFQRAADSERQTEFRNGLWTALGYEDLHTTTLDLSGGRGSVCVRGELKRSGSSYVLLLEGPFVLPETALPSGHGAEGPLDVAPVFADVPEGTAAEFESTGRLITELFAQEDAARWILLLAGSRLLRLDRHTWAEGRFIEVDLDDAFSMAQPTIFRQIAGLCARRALAPDQGEPPVDRFEDGSHRFASGVTEKLQFAVREAIEILANEWVEARRLSKRSYTSLGEDEPALANGDRAVTAKRLHHEALVYVYRLLFCLFAESRGGDSGLLPVNDDAYRLGYSLEALRDLEDALLNEEAAGGAYFHQHLLHLFGLIAGGTPVADQHAHEYVGSRTAFAVRPLTATLFDPRETLLLDRARLRNSALQRVIQRLSLSETSAGRGRGRVNYARLGITQLGAVYEGLLSYQGMFMEEDMLHVKAAAGDFRDNKTQTYFVPVSRQKDFKADELEHEETDSRQSYRDGPPRKARVRVYHKGEFVLHLNGVERERTASYYTPEVLSRTLVNEAIDELFLTRGKLTADEILGLKICEPAMGSGAFLNEAAEELARRYLLLKQEENGTQIDPVRFPDELGRARHYIATRNIYGVDLNPMAVELGSLSLWLGSMHRLLVRAGVEGAADEYRAPAVPWFGLRLRNGNSLIGARRAVWKAADLKQGLHLDGSTAPRLLKPGEARKEDEVYHFLVLDPDSAPTARDKLFRTYYPKGAEAANRRLKEWKDCLWANDDGSPAALLRSALAVSALVDQHWADYTERRLRALEATACTASVWPQPADSAEALATGPTLLEQERVRHELEAQSGSFQRLKLLMDLWCALFFWIAIDPKTAADIPTQEGFLSVAKLLLGGLDEESPEERTWLKEVVGLDLKTIQLASGDASKLPDVDSLAKALPWYDFAQRHAEEEHFFHWELVFPEVLGLHGDARGFDLMLGNPPWIKASWQDAQALDELDPLLGVRGAKSAAYNKARPKLLEQGHERDEYFREFRRSEGAVVFLNSARMYPELKGIQTNLYKNFLVRFWELLSDYGVGALLHQQGVFDDSRGGLLRNHYYARLRRHYQFRNEKQLFPILHTRTYNMNIFGTARPNPDFSVVFGLFHPRTIAECRDESRRCDPIPGTKDTAGNWELAGHPARMVRIRETELRLFARLFDDQADLWRETKLPHLHSTEMLSMIQKLADAPGKMGDAVEKYFATECFHESNAQRAEEIVREQSPSFQPETAQDWVLAGPHIFVGSPLAGSAQTDCPIAQAYDPVDLTEIPEDFLPRSPYKPGKKFKEQVPRWEGQPVTEHASIAWRRMGSYTGERTLIAALMPAGPTHVNTVISAHFTDAELLAFCAGQLASLPTDFVIRFKSAGDMYAKSMGELPLAAPPNGRGRIVARALRLNCLTNHYADLWTEACPADIAKDSWTIDDPRLTNEFEHPWNKLKPKTWDWKTPLRTDFARRLALLEIDVLVAQGLGLTLDELQTIYRVQFPVLQQYERVDEYDAKGRRLPNTARKDPGGKELRTAREERDEVVKLGKAKADKPITIEYTLDVGKKTVEKTFYPPFGGVDREREYGEIWAEWGRRLG